MATVHTAVGEDLAGFDFHFRKAAAGEPLQRAILRWSQGTARDLGLALRYKLDASEYWVVVDGPLPLMHLLGAYTAEDLYPFAAAYTVPARRSQRMQLAATILARYNDGLDAITESVREMSEALGGSPNSIVFDYGSKTHLARPLHSLSRVLIQEMQGRVSQRTAIEELHTVIELLFRSFLGNVKGLSFAQMAERAEELGVLSADAVQKVKALKDVRRDAKHRGQGFRQADGDDLIYEGVHAIHRLLFHYLDTIK